MLCSDLSLRVNVNPWMNADKPPIYGHNELPSHHAFKLNQGIADNIDFRSKSTWISLAKLGIGKRPTRTLQYQEKEMEISAVVRLTPPSPPSPSPPSSTLCFLLSLLHFSTSPTFYYLLVSFVWMYIWNAYAQEKERGIWTK